MEGFEPTTSAPKAAPYQAGPHHARLWPARVRTYVADTIVSRCTQGRGMFIPAIITATVITNDMNGWDSLEAQAIRDDAMSSYVAQVARRTCGAHP